MPIAGPDDAGAGVGESLPQLVVPVSVEKEGNPRRRGVIVHVNSPNVKIQHPYRVYAMCALTYQQ